MCTTSAAATVRGVGPSPLRATVTDAIVTASLTVALQLEVWIWWTVDEQGPKPFAALAGLLSTLPLFWRRRWPFATWAAVAGVSLVWVVVAVPQGSLLPFLVLLVAIYSVAAYAPLTAALTALVGSVGLEALFVATTTNDFADYMFIGAFVGGSWLAGRGMLVRGQRAQELFDRAVRLEVDREERAREAVAAERARIARELHDIISHTVSVMVVQAGAAEEVLDHDTSAARASLVSIQEAGRSARLELRRLLGLLRTEAEGNDRVPQPDLGQLDVLAGQLRDAGLDVSVQVDGEPQTLPPGLALSAFRIIQEALTNALKHGGPGCARVRVSYGRENLEIEVLDDGHANGVANGDGFGLVGMQERIELYDGELEHGCRPGGGYRLVARLPLPSRP
jgi:signal transduction histidine kinase